MKKMITFIALAFMALSMTAQESTTVTVHVDGIRLEDLLTDEQKAGVTNLKITGSLAEEDYAYLRNSLFLQLDTLDLLDADIDTIPSNVFNWNRTGVYTADFRVILPKALRHLADSAFSMGDADLVFELVGPFPTLDKYVYGGAGESRCNIDLSESNEYCVMDGEFLCSADGSVLFFVNDMERDGLGGSLPAGVSTIYSSAFANCVIGDKLVIPASVDSIGDMAFLNAELAIPISFHYSHHLPGLLFEATVPPRLGDDVFMDGSGYGGIDCVYVPEESIELYEQAEGWKDIGILSMENYLSIKAIEGENGSVDVSDGGEAYTLQSSKPISRVVCYSVGGQMLRDVPVMAETVAIAKSEIPGPYMLVRIYFDDGTGQVVKLSR